MSSPSRRDAGSGPLRFLDLGADAWIEALYRAVARTLKTGDIDRSKRCLNYLYTAAFLEFVRDKLSREDAPWRTLGEYRARLETLAEAVRTGAMEPSPVLDALTAHGDRVAAEYRL